MQYFYFIFFITIALNLIGMSKYCIVTKINENFSGRESIAIFLRHKENFTEDMLQVSLL